MKKIEKELYMRMAMEFTKMSKCAAKKVCCLIIKENNIVAIGLNGSLPGSINCCDKFYKDEDGIWYEKVNDDFVEATKDAHYNWSLVNETHAEINALAKANKNGVDVSGASAFVTYSPCFNCAKTLATFGIKKIYYNNEYDDFYVVKNYLARNGIDMEKIFIK